MKNKLTPHVRSLSFAVAPLAIAAAAGGCSSSPSSPGTSSTNTSSSSTATGSGSSSTAVSTSTASGATCAKHLAPGFTIVTALPSTDTHTGYYGLQPSMVLDENDDPMFTYFVGEDGGVYTLYFTRWDPCAGAFTTPLLIDTLQYGITTGSAERNAAIAYDLTTKEIGIVYNPASAGNGPGDGNTYVVLATEKAGATTFTTQMASTGLSSVVGTSQPVIAMAQGQIYIAYVQGNFNCGSGGSCQGLQLLSSTTTAQPDAGPAADGGAPPHYFTEQAINIGGVPIQARADALSIGIDASGRVGLAFFEEPRTPARRTTRRSCSGEATWRTPSPSSTPTTSRTTT